jgi:hypothetical protein
VVGKGCAVMKVKTHVKAGALAMNHSATVVRPAAK